MNEEYYNFTVRDIITDIYFPCEDDGTRSNYRLTIKLNPEYSRKAEYQHFRIALISTARYRRTYAATPLNLAGTQYARWPIEGLESFADFQAAIDNGHPFFTNNIEENSLTTIFYGDGMGYFEDEPTIIGVYITNPINHPTFYVPYFTPPLYDEFHLGRPGEEI